MAKLLPRSRFWRFAIYFICFLLVLLAIDLILVQTRRTIHPGYETTRIVAPLQEDGTIDYLAAIEEHFSRGVTNENNAVPLLFAAFGRAALPRTQPPDGITDRLGMPHLPEKGDYFISYDDYAKQKGAQITDPDPMEYTKPQPWPAKPSDLTLDWLKANDGPLAKIEQATLRPRYFVPFNGGNHPQTIVEILLPHVNTLRQAERGIITRALVRDNNGDFDGARQDLLAAHRLANLMNQSATIVEHLVGYGLEIAACRAEREIAETGKLTAEQATMLARDLAALPEPQSCADCIDISDRFMCLDMAQICAKVGPVEASRMLGAVLGAQIFPIDAQLYRFVPVSYDASMQGANQLYDGILSAGRKSSYPERAAAMQVWSGYFTRLQSGDPLSRLLSPAWPSALLVPALSKPDQSWERSRAQRRLARVALALTAFKAEHNEYPAALAELSPKYLPEIPLDNFTDKPLIYSRTAAGYTLYSVGPNMIDDGGNSTGSADDVR
ncbi:MAG TPA: hypothetical protein VH370_20905 [Humisphaera sp.]|jgi:hypothetical protein|nr:hypothetical protein [Humisphaera sp.]